MSWFTFHNTVAAVIEKDNRFLLVNETVNGTNVYNQPAGHLEGNESLIEAVIRETLEETTYQFTPTYIVGIYLYQVKNQKQAYLRIAFGGTLGAKVAGAKLDKDIIDTQWLSTKDLSALPTERLRSPMVALCIEDYLKEKRYPLDMLTYLTSPEIVSQQCKK